MTDPCADMVGRREFERTIDRLNDRITHQKEMLELQTKLTDKALQLQAEEYERRLDHLNNERQREAEQRARTLSLDTWTGFHDNYVTWRESMNTFKDNMTSRISALDGILAWRDSINTFKDNLNGRIAVYGVIVGAVWAVIVGVVLLAWQGWR